MEQDPNLEIMLREYESLRTEILERMRHASQFLGWGGAILAFGVPFAASGPSEQTSTCAIAVRVTFALAGAGVLLWLSLLNWKWLLCCADHIRRIENVVNEASGGRQLLTWENRAACLSRARGNWLPLMPKKPTKCTKHVARLKTNGASDG